MDGSNMWLKLEEARALLERVCTGVSEADVQVFFDEYNKHKDVAAALCVVLDRDAVLHHWFREAGFANIASRHRYEFSEMVIKGHSINTIINYFVERSIPMYICAGEWRRVLR